MSISTLTDSNVDMLISILLNCSYDVENRLKSKSGFFEQEGTEETENEGTGNRDFLFPFSVLFCSKCLNHIFPTWHRFG